MDISEVVRRTGIPASTLRFYEEKGLIASVGPAGTRRRYAPGVVDQLALIVLAQTAGFALTDIRAMFALDGSPSLDRTVLAAKADEIDSTIRRLGAIARGLRHAAVCPAPRHAECPTFKRLLKAAASGALASRKGAQSPAGAAVRSSPGAMPGTAPRRSTRRRTTP